ncbi:female-specific histamine-binding protein 2-like [Rhipicephalus microplus]|uniref:female-specific histamine-binding protein 2-like n=1 Tax=Rhipicephalus microplus TaxID=6941 RepID=UPI003F6BE928
MNPLAVAALASVIIASHCEQVRLIWQNESRLGNYQIAWNSLNKSSNITYYQIRATHLISTEAHNNQGQIKSNYTCWTVNIHERNENEEKAVRWYYYMLDATQEVYFYDQAVQTVSTLNYTTKNAVQPQRHRDELDADPVIFTDGEMCDLFNVPSISPTNGCKGNVIPKGLGKASSKSQELVRTAHLIVVANCACANKNHLSL